MLGTTQAPVAPVPAPRAAFLSRVSVSQPCPARRSRRQEPGTGSECTGTSAVRGHGVCVLPKVLYRPCCELYSALKRQSLLMYTARRTNQGPPKSNHLKPSEPDPMLFQYLISNTVHFCTKACIANETFSAI